jgi:competence protein ComEC
LLAAFAIDQQPSIHQEQLVAAQCACAVFALLSLLGLLCRKRWPRCRKTWFVSVWLCLVASGASWMALVTLQAALPRLADRLSSACEGVPLNLDLRLLEMPTVKDQGLRMLVEVAETQQTQPCGHIPRQISLGWQPARQTSSENHTAALWQPASGEVWRIPVTLKRPIAPLNFGGFDVERYWFSRDIGALGSIVTRSDAPAPKKTSAAAPRDLNEFMEGLREKIAAHLQRSLPTKKAQYAGIVKGLAIGDQKGITPAQWRVLTQTGTSHLVSISGMHVTLLASALAALVLKVWPRIKGLSLKLSAAKAAVLIALPVSCIYALLAGWGVPAQRTVWMLLASAVCTLMSKRPRPLDILALACLVTLTADPWAATTPGFLLSFGAVAMLLYSSVGRKSHKKQRFKGLSALLRAQWVVLVGLMPLSMALFGQQSWAGPVANAVAIPWMSFVITPLALCGALTGLEFPLVWANACIEPLWRFLCVLASQPWALQPVAQAPWWVTGISLIGAFLALSPNGIPGKWLGMACVCLPLLWQPEKPAYGTFWMEILDVGQGNSIAIRTRNHWMLVDTGSATNPENDNGLRVVLPWLWRHGRNELDVLLLSHADNDHAGGAATVLSYAHVKKLLSNDPPPQPPKSFNAPSQGETSPASAQPSPCLAGMHWEWDGVAFEILHPTPDLLNAETPDNAKSCVVKVSTSKNSALLPGDIGEEEERSLIKRLGPKALQSTVLVAPHHGSKTSSSNEFIENVQARWVVFQVGYRNRYGHPNADIVRRYETSINELFRTDKTGALQFMFSQENLVLKEARAQKSRYWTNMPTKSVEINHNILYFMY